MAVFLKILGLVAYDVIIQLCKLVVRSSSRVSRRARRKAHSGDTVI